MGPDTPLPVGPFPGYELVRELGRGGMGVVYLARNRVLDRLEAVKVVTRPWAEDQFRQEVRAAARLGHPNVVAVYAALTGGSLAFAMEYVAGDTLARLVSAQGPLPPARACEYARQAALGLQHAHERGMTHRDVKPQNLMVFRAGGRDVIKVLDFGLAKVADASRDGAALPTDGALLGTPGYAAPEQARDASAADVRSDVYSLGVTLRFLLTGRHPVPGGPPAASPPPPTWPSGLVEVLARMTAPDPGDRYPTAAEVAAALEPFTPAPEPPREAPVRPNSRRWRLFGAAASIAALVVTLVAVRLSRPEPGTSAPPAAGTEPHQPVERAYVPAFNGTDLSGWVVDGEGDQWRVEDGALVTTGTKGGPQTWLLSRHDYGDVRVRFEYQLDPGGNSGFVFRAVPGERPVLVPGGRPTATAYHQQIELSDDTDREWQWLPTGQVSGGLGRTAPMLRPHRTDPLLPPGNWYTVEVELIKQALRVTLNGDPIQTADLNELVARGSLYPALRRSHGRIGFQQFRGTARFRRIEVLDLSK